MTWGAPATKETVFSWLVPWITLGFDQVTYSYTQVVGQ